MQQQIQQHQRQLAQALLMKQQQPPPSSHPGLHPNLGKASLDTFTGHPQTSGLSISDLQTKEQQSSPNSFSPYTLCKRTSLMWTHSCMRMLAVCVCVYVCVCLFVFVCALFTLFYNVCYACAMYLLGLLDTPVLQ